MDHDIAKLLIDGVTCIAAGALAFVTWQLVRVTRHHAQYAEKMAAAADRLGEILDSQAKALTGVTELHTLVNAMAALPMTVQPNFDRMVGIIEELNQRRTAARQKGGSA